jgi:carboxyl-terminal processing protease
VGKDENAGILMKIINFIKKVLLERRFNLLTMIVAVALIVTMLLGSIVHFFRLNDTDVIYLTRLIKVKAFIENFYVKVPVDKEKLYEGALKGMVDSLGDPHSTYMDKKFYEYFTRSIEGNFVGVGIVFTMKDNKVLIIAPIEDGPSAKAGVKAGEFIVGIDGKPVSGLNSNDIVALLKGEKGTKVTMTIESKTGGKRDITVVRDTVKLESVRSKMLEDKIGYIRIASFDENTGEDFEKAYAKLEKEGMKSTILDLRSNPGGLLTEAVRVAKELVPKGIIVSEVYNDGARDVNYSHLEKVRHPLAVLVDGGSASASEIVSGAIKDTNSGEIIGTQTFGKGTVQTYFPLSSNTGAKITIAKYYTPNNISIDGVGIKPNIVVEADDSKGKNQLNTAVEYLKKEMAKVNK